MAPEMSIVLNDKFKPFPLIKGPHAQTLWASKVRRTPSLDVIFERVELPDNDFIDITWTTNVTDPIVVILHGLEGSYSSSAYIKCILRRLESAGMCGVVMHFRGCSGALNRLPRSYHAGDTIDLSHVMNHITASVKLDPFAIIGYSLGGNVLLKWLGENNPSYLKTAIAVSVPFDLSASADILNRGISKGYQWYLIKSMRKKFNEKFKKIDPVLFFDKRLRLNTFRNFDDAITAPLHGFSSADEYYEKSSCTPYLARITIETLIIHATDDPFLPPSAIPDRGILSDKIFLELTKYGGHVGFVGISGAGSLHYWLDDRIMCHLTKYLR